LNQPEFAEIVDAPPPATSCGALAALEPTLAEWFQRTHGAPTLAQRYAWPILAEGKNLLLCAPTGSGKTLAAFLPALGAILRQPTRLSCLYLAPQRALCADAAKALQHCLNGLPADCGLRLASRTGDTSAYRRRRLWEDPPHVLITTPESLALMLAHPAAREALRGVRHVVVDEVHAVADTKRGADLAVSLERLADLADRDPQRIGLSATCSPLVEAARWLAGAGRSVAAANIPDPRPLELRVEYLPPEEIEPAGFMRPLLRRLRPILENQATTLIFTNTRSVAERLVWKLREELPALASRTAVHHSAVAAARRREIEAALKAGELRVVVSSTSLELGIDIGSVEQVVLLHPPGGTARLLQRVGRSGHGPGRLRRGVLFAANPADLAEGVVTAESGACGQLEALKLPEAPLDVLCQQLVGLAAQESWTAARAFELVRRAYPFRTLKLEQFENCLAYLSGQCPAAARMPRLRWRDGQFRILNRRTLRLYRTNVGVISSEEVRTVRLDDGPALGAVAETFADRLEPGDRFLLGGRCLELSNHGPRELTVLQASGLPLFTRWQGGFWRAPQELAERLWLFRRRWLDERRDVADAADQALADFFDDQEAQSAIPNDDAVLIEVAPDNEGEGLIYAFHLPLAQPGCEAAARVVVHRLGRERCRVRASGMLGFTIAVDGSRPLTGAELASALEPEGFERDLERSLAGGTLLAERFRAAAITGLMLLKNPLGRRRVVGGRHWAGRRLLNWLRFADPQFPLLRQAIHDTLHEALHVEHAAACLKRLAGLPLAIRRLPALSPFASAWEAQRVPFVPISERPPGLPASAAGSAVVLHEDEWALTPQHAAVHLPTRSAVIADVHLGYDAARQAAGEAVPTFSLRILRERIETLRDHFGVQRIVVAGDLVEDSRQTEALRAALVWLNERGLAVWLTPGNHDRGLPLLEGLQVFPGGLRLGRWLIVHELDAARRTPQAAGHVHPTVRLRGLSRPSPCFLAAPGRLILPAFSEDAAGLRLRSPNGLGGYQCHAIVNGEIRTVGSSQRAEDEITSTPARLACP